MENAVIRQQLHTYIDSVDENKLQAMYIILQTDMEQNPVYDDAVMSILHQRRNNHLYEVSASYSVNETLAYARGRNK